MRLFITGAGYSGRSIAQELRNSADWIGGTTRSPERLSALADDGLSPVLFDGKQATVELKEALGIVTHLVQSIAPSETGDPVLALAGDALQEWMPDLEWVGYLSTVGVYGDHNGGWVDETSPCRPVSRRSVWRHTAESNWIGWAQQSGVPVSILRLSGIYGPRRNALNKLHDGTARRLIKPGQVFNRIHVDDIAGATAHLAHRAADGIWNVTDDLPAPPQDVVAFAGELMGIDPPPEMDFETADLTPMARSFYGENKRVSNRKLTDSGYRFRYPDFRSALSALWRDGNWQA